MYKINNEEHINNIKRMVDGIIPKKGKKINFRSIYNVHKYNYICSEVNSSSSNDIEYLILLYTTRLNSTNRQNIVNLFTTLMVSFFTTIVTICVAIFPNIDKETVPIIFKDLSNYILLFMIVLLFAIFLTTLCYDKKMKKYEYILSILQNEQIQRTKPQTNRQQSKRKQNSRNKNYKK